MDKYTFVYEEVNCFGDKYVAVPEYRRSDMDLVQQGCEGCAFEAETLANCQRSIGQPATMDRPYCVSTMNPYNIDIIWINKDDIDKYIVKVVSDRMTNQGV